MKRLLIAISGAGLMFLLGCAANPSATLAVSEESGRTVFQISTRGVRGILDFTIWQAESRNLLWDVNLDYYSGPKLIYGELPRGFVAPNGTKRDAQQKYPADGRQPDRFPPNARIFVGVVLQYDSLLAASATTRYFLLTTDTAGAVTSVVPVKMNPDDFPKE